MFITSIYPGYVQTELSQNALSSQAGVKHGKLDESTKKGLLVEKFADIALRSIYLKEREKIISDSAKNAAAIPLRNLFPDLIFWLIEKEEKE